LLPSPHADDEQQADGAATPRQQQPATPALDTWWQLHWLLQERAGWWQGWHLGPQDSAALEAALPREALLPGTPGGRGGKRRRRPDADTGSGGGEAKRRRAGNGGGRDAMDEGEAAEEEGQQEGRAQQGQELGAAAQEAQFYVDKLCLALLMLGPACALLPPALQLLDRRVPDAGAEAQQPEEAAPGAGGSGAAWRQLLLRLRQRLLLCRQQAAALHAWYADKLREQRVQAVVERRLKQPVAVLGEASRQYGVMLDLPEAWWGGFPASARRAAHQHQAVRQAVQQAGQQEQQEQQAREPGQAAGQG
jgi:hypothetical protein